MIVKQGSGYVVKSHDGKKKLGGPYKTEKEAKQRLRQVAYYKNMSKHMG